ncbi:Aste57867_10108 [Aphanomyces stellatus]|uniref:Aste57867_10108 protein n=1 Tax=Aphanomyces stellatus TaxID=120398 RepID=A0A485KQ16_9STRA|nr:hypothetical protein As57867_010069 [Aphanomyces stellatus]VFT86984.1 Aste57867_10108 [Aphanomyces stellatus]
MQPSGSSGDMDKKPPLEWRPYGVLLLSGQTKTEKASKESLLTVLSGALTPREKGVFRVVTRGDLAAEKHDPDGLASAFFKLLERDRLEYTQIKAPPPAAVAAPVAPTAAPPVAAAATTAKPTLIRKESVIKESSQRASDVGNATDQPPDDDMLKAANVALDVDARTGSPSHIYVFVDYPATVAEVKSLLTLKAVPPPSPDAPKQPPTLTALIDGVVTMLVSSSKDEARRKSIAAAQDTAAVAAAAAAAVVETAKPAPPGKGGKGGKQPPPQKEPPPPVAAPPPEPIPVAASPPSDSPDPSEMNRFFKELQAAAAVGGLEWTDFTFDTVDCGDGTGDARPLAALTSEFKTLLTNMAVDKVTFKQWLASVQIVQVPTQDTLPEKHMDGLKRAYADLLDGLYEPSISISAIVYAMTETVVKSFVKPSQPPQPLKKKHTLSNVRAPLVAAAAPSEPPKTYKLPPFIEYGDVSTGRMARALHQFLSKHESIRSGEPTTLLDHALDDLERKMWLLNDLPGVGHGGRKGMPLVPTKSLVDRGIDDTELMQFHSLAMEDVHYTRKMMQFEEMLGPRWHDKLRSRTHVEHLTPPVLPQRIAALVGLNVRFVKRYYVPDDSLLLAGHIETPQGRKATSTWSAATCVRHRPPFKDWRQENLLPQEYLTPRTVQALGAVVALSLGELQAVSETTQSLFPSDHAVVHVLRTPYSRNWLSVYKDTCVTLSSLSKPTLRCRHVFGLRPSGPLFPESSQAKGGSSHPLPLPRTPPTGKRPATPATQGAAPRPSVQWTDFPSNFHASFSDDSHLRITRGPGKTIVVTHTAASGLVLTLSSDGSIRQQYANATDHAASPNQHEACRVIVGRGTVVSTRKDGSQVIMYANGSAATRPAAGAPFFTVDDQGMVSCSDPTLPRPPNVRVHLDVDPETRAVIARRDDGVLVVTHPNGHVTTMRRSSYLTQHEDGTRMLGNAVNSHVIVQKEGFAEVSIDVDVNLTAQRHAQGMKVAVTKGGIRTRSILRVYDGTVIEIDYDTRVIASVNGIIRVRKPDGTVVIAHDNGVVEFRPRSLSRRDDSPPTPRREDEEELDTSTGAYYFNCAVGSMQMSDPEHNSYQILVGDGAMEPHVQVELAGIVTAKDCTKYDVPPLPVQAVVNDPLEPFLLVLHGDGTATEVLRPNDVVDYLHQVQRNVHVQQVACVSADMTTRPSMHIYLHHLDRFEHNDAWFADHKERRHLLEHTTIPARASAALQKHLHNTVPLQEPRVHIVRRIKEITPFDKTQFDTMMKALEAWQAWSEQRDVAQDQYAVFDPRDSETMVATMAVQKKIQAAYKAARAKKKSERQKTKEKHDADAAGEKANMSTLQEVGSTTKKTKVSIESQSPDTTCCRRVVDDEAFQAMVGDDSDDDSRGELDLNVDDDYELTLTAFGQADTENTGRLNAVQTRRALVHALGYGVTQTEVNNAIHVYTESEDRRVTFEAFSRMLNGFRDASTNQDESASSESMTPFASPRAGSLKLKSPRNKSSPRVIKAPVFNLLP